MTISIDFHVSYVLQYFQTFPENQLVCELHFNAGTPGFDNFLYHQTISGLGIDPVNPDEPNDIYANVNDAIEHYKDQLCGYIIDTINANSNEEYAFSGNLIRTNVENQILLDEKQPLDSTLTALSGTSTATFGRSLLGAINAAGGRTLLGAGTSNFDGDYANLSNKPTIPSSQVNSDWNAVSGVTQIVNKPEIPSVTRTTSTSTLSLVGTGATGTQIHATKDSTVRYNVSTSTTSSIGGPATSVVILKICATNSSTEGDWTPVATAENDQTITLAIALQSIQVVKEQLCSDVPAGWYVKLVNSGSGTHSESFITGQKTIYG